MNFDDYRQIDAVNWSTLKSMATSPLEYRYRLSTPVESTAAMRLGTAFHALLLEPDSFAARYAVEPDFGDCRAKANKAARDEWREAHAGVAMLSQRDHDAAHRMRDAVMAHDVAAEYLRDLELREHSWTWTDAETGLVCKARQDGITEHDHVSVKSTLDPTPFAFGREVHKRLYHGQEAFYADGFATATGRALTTVFVVAQNREPWDVAVYRVPRIVMIEGTKLCRRLLDTLARCRRLNHWPGAAPQEMELAFPEYGMSDEDVDWGDEAAAE